jgi:hypothetical protein
MWQYTCRQCGAVGEPVATEVQARIQRADHRLLAHGNLVPPGESIDRVPGGTRDPDARYVNGWHAAVVCALLAAASLIARALGH